MAFSISVLLTLLYFFAKLWFQFGFVHNWENHNRKSKTADIRFSAYAYFDPTYEIWQQTTHIMQGSNVLFTIATLLINQSIMALMKYDKTHISREEVIGW